MEELTLWQPAFISGKELAKQLGGGKIFTKKIGFWALQINLFGLDVAIRDSSGHFLISPLNYFLVLGSEKMNQMKWPRRPFQCSINWLLKYQGMEAPQNVSRTRVKWGAPSSFGCLQFLMKSPWESSWFRFSLQSWVPFSYWIDVKTLLMNVLPAFPEAEGGTWQCAWGQSGAFFRRDCRLVTLMPKCCVGRKHWPQLDLPYVYNRERRIHIPVRYP